MIDYRYLMKNILLLIFLVTGLVSCHKEDNYQFRQLSPGQTGINFNNRIFESDSFNVLTFSNIYTGGGVAAGDFNNDGWEDLFFSGNMVSSRLYLNQQQQQIRFKDITEIARVSTDRWISGVTTVDINQDGWLDIYACATGSKSAEKRKNLLFVNQGLNAEGIPVFKESAADYNLDDHSYTTQAAFFDYDKDGDLDVYMIVNLAENYYSGIVNLPIVQNQQVDPDRSDKLYRNNAVECQEQGIDCQELFTDVSVQAGITFPGYSLGLVVSDLNNDSWPDIYIANDFLADEILYMNNRDGTFSNRTAEYLKHTSFAGRGADLADYNNDGWVDIFVADMVPEDNQRLKSMQSMANYDRFMMTLENGYIPQFSRNSLQLNNGTGTEGDLHFSEIGQLAKIHHTDWSWSILLADFDLDGWKDLFVANGFKRDMQDLDFVHYVQRPQYVSDPDQSQEDFVKAVHELPGIYLPNYLFKNQGDLTFSNVSDQWMERKPSFSHGATYADLDQDGDQDLVVANLDEPPFIMANQTINSESQDHHFVKIKLKGQAPNLRAVGSRITLYVDSLMQMQENLVTRGFQSSISPEFTFGLGKSRQIDSLQIQWYTGQVQTMTRLKADTTYTFSLNLKHLPAAASSLPKPPVNPWFKSVAVERNLNYKDQEYDFVDFHYQRLLHKKLSQEGPGIAVADINGDQLEDIYLGGSRYYPGQLFIQEPTGKFRGKAFHEDKNFEDAGLLFFDADQDGDQDLYLASGSNEMSFTSSYYQDRLYRNDGQGNFKLAEKALPPIPFSSSCIKAADFDRDGDLDIFAGSRSLPGRYPLPAPGFIIVNQLTETNQLKFEDHTSLIVSGFDSLGMVTDALWTDFDQDGWIDLLVVGDWMPVTFYRNQGGKLVKARVMSETYGWWNSLLGGDFDRDGDTDYVVGNYGLNNRYQVSKNQPARMYVKDFDENGSLDPLFTYYIQGKEVLAHPRDELIEQMVVLRKKFKTYADYARITAPQLLAELDTTGMHVFKCNNLASIYLENKGSAEFVMHRLPQPAQFAPVYGMAVGDFNQDKNPDIMITGNSYASEIETGFNDASHGYILTGNGQGHFSSTPKNTTGFMVDSDAKGLAELVDARDQSLYLSAANNDYLKVFVLDQAYNQVIRLEDDDVCALIHLDDNSLIKQEFYYGNSFYSHGSRTLKVYDYTQKIEIFKFTGEKRTIDLNSIARKN
ncbi:MAG: VCBS repeat-containing protein [Candidatus Cyclobacteriaceae bacterium M3_2C_046]